MSGTAEEFTKEIGNTEQVKPFFYMPYSTTIKYFGQCSLNSFNPTIILSDLCMIPVRVKFIVNVFQIRTERNAFTAIGVTWIVILLVSVPVYVSHGEVTYTYSSAEHTACVFLEEDAVNRPDGYNKPIFQVCFIEINLSGSWFNVVKWQKYCTWTYFSGMKSTWTMYGREITLCRPVHVSPLIRFVSKLLLIPQMNWPSCDIFVVHVTVQCNKFNYVN